MITVKKIKTKSNILTKLGCTIFLKKFFASPLNENELSPNKLLRFVPKSQNLEDEDFKQINDFVLKSKKLLVLSGAGLSTESGIPDYRSEKGLYSTTSIRPMEYSEFVKSSKNRRNYWARNFVSWKTFSSLKPNTGHNLLSEWEKKGKVHHHVTQNVDSLLVKAGCNKLTELHGSSYRVVCINCNFRMTRESMQILIHSVNPDWNVFSEDLNPDNDVKLSEEQTKTFCLPNCPKCNQDKLKPDLVFFGDNIPRDTVKFVEKKVSESDALLAIGTSLQVYSAYRIILQAKDLNLPICILGIGNTRGDKHSTIKISSSCSETLKKIKF